MSDEGEEWKGEPEPPPAGQWFTGKVFFGPAETEEQKSKRLADEARYDLMGELLPPLRLAGKCVKCGGEKTKTRFCSGGGSWCRPKTGNHEHMHRTCRRCKYEWYEKPLSPEDS